MNQYFLIGFLIKTFAEKRPEVSSVSTLRGRVGATTNGGTWGQFGYPAGSVLALAVGCKLSTLSSFSPEETVVARGRKKTAGL